MGPVVPAWLFPGAWIPGEYLCTRSLHDPASCAPFCMLPLDGLPSCLLPSKSCSAGCFREGAKQGPELVIRWLFPELPHGGDKAPSSVSPVLGSGPCWSCG